jgi:hypothetical protein
MDAALVEKKLAFIETRVRELIVSARRLGEHLTALSSVTAVRAAIEPVR